MANIFKTSLLLIALTALLLFVGGLIGGRGGMMFALVFAFFLNFFSWWYSDSIVLKLYRARPLSEEEAPHIYRIVRRLAQNAEIPMPRLYVVPTETPNAFATGRNPSKGVVAVTTGLLNLLNEKEIEGVIAHEIAHIKHRDTLISTVVATVAGAIMMLANMARWAAIFGGFSRDDDNAGGIIGLLAVSILAPIAAILINAAISRSREFHADETGAKIAGSPQGLMSALEKLHYASMKIPFRNVNPATSHMFIVNPLAGRKMSIFNLFATHPPIEKRIERLSTLM